MFICWIVIVALTYVLLTVCGPHAPGPPPGPMPIPCCSCMFVWKLTIWTLFGFPVHDMLLLFIAFIIPPLLQGIPIPANINSTEQ
jgi:hypothetical protein